MLHTIGVHEDVEQRAKQIARSANHLRKPLPRGVWILALIVGLVGVIGAVVVWTVPAEPGMQRPIVGKGDRFSIGLLLGLVGGLVIGWVLGRRTSGPGSIEDK